MFLQKGAGWGVRRVSGAVPRLYLAYGEGAAPFPWLALRWGTGVRKWVMTSD